MRGTDRSDSFEATEGPGAEPVAPRRPHPDPGPVLRFARELGRLLGDHLARAGFPPDEPMAPTARPAYHRCRRDP
jgi:hypothetical protein